MSKTPKEIWCRSGLYYEYVDDWSEGSWSPINDGGVKYVRADRIEELEERLKAAQDDAKEAEAYAEELEAKLEKAVDFIEDLTGCEWPYDEGAKRILAELTGGKDE